MGLVKTQVSLAFLHLSFSPLLWLVLSQWLLLIACNFFYCILIPFYILYGFELALILFRLSWQKEKVDSAGSLCSPIIDSVQHPFCLKVLPMNTKTRQLQIQTHTHKYKNPNSMQHIFCLKVLPVSAKLFKKHIHLASLLTTYSAYSDQYALYVRFVQEPWPISPNVSPISK